MLTPYSATGSENKYGAASAGATQTPTGTPGTATGDCLPTRWPIVLQGMMGYAKV
jgi:hypothetical protein